MLVVLDGWGHRTDETHNASAPPRLRINELFLSLQGESLSQGLPTVFIRLTGCPLRCNYCDTDYAFSTGKWIELTEIVRQTDEYGVRRLPVCDPVCLLPGTR